MLIALLWLDEGPAAIRSFLNDVVAANRASNSEGLGYPRAPLKTSIEKDSVDVAYEPCSHLEGLQLCLEYAN